MDDTKCRELLRLTWSVVLRQNELLGIVIPTTRDVAQTVISGHQPTPQQVVAWTEVNKQVTQDMLQLSAALAGLQQSIAPLIGFDA